MKLFRNLFMAAAALTAVYALSSFPVPAVAEQAIFTSQAAADAVEPLQAATVVKAVVVSLALLAVLFVVSHAFRRRRAHGATAANFNGGYDADTYHLDAGIPRIREPRLREPGPSG